MEKYLNRSGRSNVKSFEIETTKITVIFNDNSKYTYSYNKAGRIAVEEMKRLAKMGSGLNSYIMKNVRKDYD
jgi:phosphotransferase system IIB component